MVEYEAPRMTGRIESWKEEIPGKMEKKAEEIARKGTEISERAAEKRARISRSMADTLKRMASDIRNINMENYRKVVDDQVANVKTGIRQHPFASVAVAAGIGFMAGAVISMMGRYEER